MENIIPAAKDGRLPKNWNMNLLFLGKSMKQSKQIKSIMAEIRIKNTLTCKNDKAS